MSPAVNNKRLVVAGVVLTASVALYVTVYLPFYSQDIVELRKKAQNRPTSGNSKSVWANLDKEIKNNKDD